jgi:hypothetical protein
MKCAVITTHYSYNGKIINHAGMVPRLAKSGMIAAYIYLGCLVLYSTTTTYYAIANQSPLYDAVFSQIEYPYISRRVNPVMVTITL